MKSLPFLALFATLILTSSYVSAVIATPATENVITVEGFKSFRIHRQANGVALSWEVSSPEVVQFIVERSYDGEYFDAINAMNCNGTSTHKFNDDNVYPGVIYYRIVGVKGDNSTVTSPIETVRIIKRR